MEKEKIIEVLNFLIIINNERIKGYETASTQTEEADFKSLFAKFISTSQQCKNELVREVKELGGDAALGTKPSGKFFRAWLGVTVALRGSGRKAILNACECGEDEAKDTYERALENDFGNLYLKQKAMIIAQKSLLKNDHDHIKVAREELSINFYYSAF